MKDRGAKPQLSHLAVPSSGEPAVPADRYRLTPEMRLQGAPSVARNRTGVGGVVTTQSSGLFNKGLFELCVNISLKNT